jgi:integrase
MKAGPGIPVRSENGWFVTASYHRPMHLTKGHRSNRLAYLRKAEVQRLREFKSFASNATENDFVFQHPEHPGKAMTEWDALRGGLKPAGRKIGIKLTWHQLRHWTGTMLYRAGVPVKVIQARLGHSMLELLRIGMWSPLRKGSARPRWLYRICSRMCCRRDREASVIGISC